MEARRIATLGRAVDATLRAVPSKSATHRALVAAALADGPSVLHGPLHADDTRRTRDGLAALGIAVSDRGADWVVHGAAGRVRGGADIRVGDSGTTMRFLLAVAALGRERSSLDGSARMRERPVQPLAEALRRLGGDVVSGPSPGGLPVQAGGGALRGGAVVVESRFSSQFASALLLVGPTLPAGLQLSLAPGAVSLPYVELTAAVLSAFGGRVQRVGPLEWSVAPGPLRSRSYVVEGDHSSASYWLAAAALCGGRVRVDGLAVDSAQADARFTPVLRELGCRVSSGESWVEVESTGALPGFDLDLNEAPDLAPTATVLALFAHGPSRIRAIGHVRHKETDRLDLLHHNVQALGRPARIEGDDLEILGAGPDALQGGVVRTGSDHRLAMAFAIAGLRLSGLSIDDPACVAKSNPSFWSDFEAL